jgi:hypothetical protein
MLEKITKRKITNLVDSAKTGITSHNTSHAPRCSHGAALRFSRTDKNTGLIRDFYACSVTRDRKLCRMFHWVEDWERKISRPVIVQSSENFDPSREKKTRYDSNLGLDTFVDNSSNAQFTFDRDSISLIVSLCRATKPAIRVLCLGTPSIYVELQKQGINSVLLDEDERLAKIANSVYRYNMFTGDFFASNPNLFDDFTVIICDPPFHPELLRALFDSLKRTFPSSYNSALLLFAFPYFFHEQVVSACSRLTTMTDVRLTYSNHKKYTSAKRSPVRLFISEPTLKSLLNDPPKGYRYCAECDEIVSEVNRHCAKCKRCTSIAGNRPYKHCEDCKLCVKESAVHCFKCRKCFISSTHTCSNTS